MVEGLCWGSPSEGLAGSAVEGSGDSGEVAGGVPAQVGALGEVLAQYLSIRSTERLDEAGAACSVGSRRDSDDNTLAETIIGL